jgi:beta-galactosidase
VVNVLAVRIDLLRPAATVVTADRPPGVSDSFQGGRLDGRPAFTVNPSGRGRAYYLATVPDDSGTALVIRYVPAQAGVEPVVVGLPEFVEVARRGHIITLINQGTTTVDLDLSGFELATGADIGRLRLKPFSYALVRSAGSE